MTSFLSPNKAGRLCITAEDETFDPDFLRDCELEGFEVVYLPFQNDTKRYRTHLDKVKEGLSVSDSYGVIAFGDAAAFCLDHYLQLPNNNKLCALVAYYPTRIPDPEAQFPRSVHVLVHFANQDVDVTYSPRGSTYKRLVERRHIGAGMGTGDRLSLGYLAYAYPSAKPGFAEHDLEEYDTISAGIAWSRTMRTLQGGFERELDLEKVWDETQEARYFSSSEAFNPMSSYVSEKIPSSAIYGPTLQSANGTDELRRFYETVFVRGKPPSMSLRLLSRTVGADRVVDELYMSFKHSQRMDWILPDIPPTHKQVDVIIISIVSFRGGKLSSEHVHWDQASVLTQVGLLDAKLVPQRHQDVERIPLIGSEEARTILRDGSST